MKTLAILDSLLIIKSLQKQNPDFYNDSINEKTQSWTYLIIILSQ